MLFGDFGNKFDRTNGGTRLMSLKESVDSHPIFNAIDGVLQNIDTKELRIKYYPDLWYFIGLIEEIHEKKLSGEWSVDKCMDEQKKLVKGYFKEINV